ncbi:MAG: hypothetical protein HWE25_02135 [Alphaproteobacteria bacterium]|nr:hypothetical protein [Alphaproteobacteria bacterium]
MTAPFEIANRFDVLVAQGPHALDTVLSHFPLAPARVNTARHRDGTLSVTIIAKNLAEANARAIQHDLKQDTKVLRAKLEHYVG